MYSVESEDITPQSLAQTGLVVVAIPFFFTALTPLPSLTIIPFAIVGGVLFAYGYLTGNQPSHPAYGILDWLKDKEVKDYSEMDGKELRDRYHSMEFKLQSKVEEKEVLGPNCWELEQEIQKCKEELKRRNK